MNILTYFLLSSLTSAAFSLPFEILETSEVAARLTSGSFFEKMSALAALFGERMFPQSLLLSVLLCLFYRQFLHKERSFSLSALILGGVFSISMIVGECAKRYQDLAPLFLNLPQILITGIKFIGFFPFFYTAVYAGFTAIDHHAEIQTRKKEKTKKDSRIHDLFENHPFAFAFVVILLCWIPYAVAFYPGFVPSDGLKQLNNFFGIGHFSDNHPAFSTMLMGWAMKAGRALGKDHLGIFLFCGTQLCVTAGALSANFPVFRLLKTPNTIRWGCLVCFALLPFWPNYGYSLLKDTLYMDMLLIYMLSMIRILKDPSFFQEKRTLNISGLTLTLLLMALVRHEGKYIILVSFPFLFIPKNCRTHKKALLCAFVIPLVLVSIFNNMIRPALHIADAPAREAMTLPFRQTAKVILTHSSELDTKTSEDLKGFFENYDTIPEMYSISNGDYMKGLFDPYADTEKVLSFYRTWAKLGVRYPLTYLDVFLCCSYGYLYPFTGPYRELYGWFGIEQEPYVNQGLFDISYTKSFESLRTILTNWADAVPKLPLSGLFYSLGLNAWILCFCIAFLLRKKIRGSLVPLLPALISLVLCLNTAINGFFRYMLPVLISLPAALAWCVSEGKKTNKK